MNPDLLASTASMDETNQKHATSNRPIASFVIFAYNQEEHIREAIEGALSQTYLPLEVILSDDCSTDRTFEIMQQIAHNYEGPIKIKLNKNSSNLGLIGHINTVIPLTSGEWIIMAAGDDISAPERTTRIIDLTINNPTIRSIFSDIIPVSKSTVFRDLPSSRAGVYSFPDTLESHGACGLGATQAWHRELWEKFGPLPMGLLREDAVLPFRASLAGGVLIDSLKLVSYRVSQNSLSAGYFRKPTKEAMLKARLGELAELRSMALDIFRAVDLGLISLDQASSVTAQLSRMERTGDCTVALLQGSRITRLIRALKVLSGYPPYRSLCGNWKFRMSLARLAFA